MLQGMDGKFLLITGVASVLTFSGVWSATAPTPRPSVQPITATAPDASASTPNTARQVDYGAPFEDSPRPASALPEEISQRAISKETPHLRDNSVYYPNCNAARAAGAAPIYASQPGYRPEMDGDGDGIACEPYRGRR